MSKRKSQSRSDLPVATPEQIDGSILIVRGQKALLDEQPAAFYGVETKVLLQAIKRNKPRFPSDFMFQLNREEWDGLRSQFATSRSSGHGGRRYWPYALQGVAMLSSVLRSSRAIEVNIQIMRAFVRLRQLLSEHRELAERLTKLEQQMRASIIVRLAA